MKISSTVSSPIFLYIVHLPPITDIKPLGETSITCLRASYFVSIFSPSEKPVSWTKGRRPHHLDYTLDVISVTGILGN